MAGCFMRRRAYVEFFEKNKCRITNQYQTKEFDLSTLPRNKVIDFPSLKVVEEEESSFSADIERDEDRFSLAVYVVVREGGDAEPVGAVSLKNNKQDFRAVVWEE